MEYKKEWELQDIEEDFPDDKRSMNVMVHLANQIHPNLVMMGDCPSKHSTGRVPMLDLAFYMEMTDVDVNTDIGWFRVAVEQVSYGFYKKPMASKLILRSSTAKPMKMKYENATDEPIRRVLNTTKGNNNYRAQRMAVTNTFMKTLQLSGYNEEFRHQTVLSA